MANSARTFTTELPAQFSACLRFASGLGTGAVTSFTYAYFVAAALVSVTATSLGVVSSVPLTRDVLSPARASRHVISASLVSFAAVAAAAALVDAPGLARLVADHGYWTTLVLAAYALLGSWLVVVVLRDLPAVGRPEPAGAVPVFELAPR